MERELSLWQRIDLQMHLLLCGICRRFRVNVLAIRQMAISQLATSDKAEDCIESPVLSLEAKTRIRNAIRQHLG